MTGSILTLNAGSSSLKFALFDTAAGLKSAVRGEIEELDAAPHFIARDALGEVLAERRWPKDASLPFHSALETLFDFTDAHLGLDGLIAAGHRIVDGGGEHSAPELVTAALMADLETLTPLDPLHMPDNLAPIRAISAARPSLTQAVCFDTAFHHTMPPVAQLFALPRAVSEAGVRRFGFHGLSYEYIASRLKLLSPALAKGRVIAAHLGGGASLCALQGGVSIETTTSFSALDGLVMATCCGSLDPGVVLYLGRQGRSFAAIEEMLYRHSGLLGVSGISGDVRVLLDFADPHAHAAIELFTYRIACQAGALVSALGGLDGLVFTAGIGENSAAIRERVCARLEWLGVRLDNDANVAGANRISAANSAVEVLVIATDEEAMIARHTQTAIEQPVMAHVIA